MPSAGGLYPLELYVLARNVNDLATGLYHYDCVADDLAFIAARPWEGEAKKALYSWSHVNCVPAIIGIGAAFDKTQVKYGPRGYRYILLEAGHVAQNICLAVGELGMSSLCLGGYRDSVLNRLLKLDGSKVAVVYTVAVGESADG